MTATRTPLASPSPHGAHVRAHVPPLGSRAGCAATTAFSMVAMMLGFVVGARSGYYFPGEGFLGALIALWVTSVLSSLVLRWGRWGRWQQVDGWDSAMRAVRSQVASARSSGVCLQVGGVWWTVITPEDLRRPSTLLETADRQAAERFMGDLGAAPRTELRVPIRRTRWVSLVDVALLASVVVHLFGDSLPGRLFRDSSTLLPLLAFVLPGVAVLGALARPALTAMDMIELRRGTATVLSDRSFAIEHVSPNRDGQSAVLTMIGGAGDGGRRSVRARLFGGSVDRPTQLRILSAILKRTGFAGAGESATSLSDAHGEK